MSEFFKRIPQCVSPQNIILGSKTGFNSPEDMGVGWRGDLGDTPPPNSGAQNFGRKRDLLNAILGKENSNFLRLPANFLKFFLKIMFLAGLRLKRGFL